MRLSEWPLLATADPSANWLVVSCASAACTSPEVHGKKKSRAPVSEHLCIKPILSQATTAICRSYSPAQSLERWPVLVLTMPPAALPALHFAASLLLASAPGSTATTTPRAIFPAIFLRYLAFCRLFLIGSSCLRQLYYYSHEQVGSYFHMIMGCRGSDGSAIRRNNMGS